MLVSTFGLALLLAAEPAATWMPLIPDASAAPSAPELAPNALAISTAPTGPVLTPPGTFPTPETSAPAPEAAPVIVMQPVSTTQNPYPFAAFSQTEAPANEKKGWFSKLFGNRPRKRPEPQPFAQPIPRQELAPSRHASPLLQRKVDRAASDQILISRCRAHLYNDQQLTSAPIHVASDQGTIYLQGTVASASLRDRAELIARKTAGARGVVNQLSVREANQPWFQNSPVRLTAPLANDGTPMPTNVLPPAVAQPLEPARVAVANTQPAMIPPPGSSDFAIPPSPVAGGPGEPSSAQQPASFNVPPSPWQAANPAPAAGPVVQLGRPEVLSSRPGLPTVTTFLIRRTEEMGWPNAPAAPLSEPQETQVAEESSMIRPTARFVIPSPTAASTTQQAYIAQTVRSPVPTIATSAGQPAILGANGGLRADIDTLLASEPAARGIRYRFTQGELILSGDVATSDYLYQLAGRLSELPGVDVISFENLQIRN